MQNIQTDDLLQLSKPSVRGKLRSSAVQSNFPNSVLAAFHWTHPPAGLHTAARSA